jgi:hypothetical protein
MRDWRCEAVRRSSAAARSDDGALLAGARCYAAIADYARDNSREVLDLLQVGAVAPHESTIRRVLQALDPVALEPRCEPGPSPAVRCGSGFSAGHRTGCRVRHRSTSGHHRFRIMALPPPGALRALLIPASASIIRSALDRCCPGPVRLTGCHTVPRSGAGYRRWRRSAAARRRRR